MSFKAAMKIKIKILFGWTSPLDKFTSDSWTITWWATVSFFWHQRHCRLTLIDLNFLIVRLCSKCLRNEQYTCQQTIVQASGWSPTLHKRNWSPNQCNRSKYKVFWSLIDVSILLHIIRFFYTKDTSIRYILNRHLPQILL